MYGTLALLTLAALSPGESPLPSDPDTAAMVRVDSLVEIERKLARALNQQRMEEALRLTGEFVTHPEFAGLPEERRHAAWYLTGLLSLQLEGPESATPWFILATDSPLGTQEEWFYRIQTQTSARDATGAARSVAAMIRRFPGTMDEINADFVARLAGAAEVDEEAAFDLRAALLLANWDHPDASTIWLALIDDLMARDRVAEALPIVARVTTPAARLKLFSLRRYDAVRPGDAVLDIAPLFALSLAAERKASEKPDAPLQAVSAYAGSLLVQGRYAEAVRIADLGLARPVPEGDDDETPELTWIMDTRARALMGLGRHEEALAQMTAAAERSEYGTPNISQTVNLAWLYLRLGRDAEALETVRPIAREAASPFGWMQAVLIRACAAGALGDEAQAAPARAHLAEHWRDAPDAAYVALACRGDEAGMADLMVARLADPDTADGAVSALHDYLPPAHPTDFDRRTDELHARVRARPEVIAARDVVGRAWVVPTTGPAF